VTYDAICRGVADDAEILALLGEAPVAQRRPNLLLAAVHFLLLAGVPHRLAFHYDTVQSIDGGGVDDDGAVSGDRNGSGEDGMRAHSPNDDVATDFKDFCHEHHAELLELISVRSTQTNEVGRCAALLPALNHIAAGYPHDQPLSLLDLGTSAGLNLLFDSYGYTYRGRSDGRVARAGTDGADGADVHLDCTVRSELDELPALRFPPITARTGIDAAPIDPMSDDGALWLLACLWPDNLRRFARLRAALHVARTTTHPPTVHRGDIIDDLDEVVAGIAASCPLVVFHSWVAAYLSPQQQGNLVETVRALSRSRPLHYLYAESPVETPGLPTPPDPRSGATANLATALVHLPADGTPPVRLANMHPHGNWLQWWVTPPGPRGHHVERERPPLRS
jgi:hypothetical protein